LGAPGEACPCGRADGRGRPLALAHGVRPIPGAVTVFTTMKELDRVIAGAASAR
jgi:hypothetical protein